MAAIIQMVADYFEPATRRREPQGANFRDAVNHMHDWPNPEVAPSPDEELAYIEALNAPDNRRAPVEKFDPHDVHYEIRRLSVEIKSLEYERDQFDAKITERIDRRHSLRQQWMKETEKLGCFELLEGTALTPALPNGDDDNA